MPVNSRKNPWPILALIACLGVSACSGKFPGIYRIPIQQGNVITVEMLQQLELGMDKRKVSFILGTPLVTDAFHLNRWDYFYSYEPGSGAREQQTASLFFEEDRLTRIDANINSQLEFHTVTKASDNVLIVPKKKKGGFFAALTPAFVAKEEEEIKQDEIARSLDSGFNEPQPGSEVAAASEETGEALDPALAAPAIIGPGLGSVTTPSEVYAPNSSAEFNTAGAWSTPAGDTIETISAETRSQARYLEELFGDFGAGPAPAVAPAPEAISEPSVVRSSILTGTTRD